MNGQTAVEYSYVCELDTCIWDAAVPLCELIILTVVFLRFAGDGAGVGKGRTIAGVIFENYLKGRKRAIWVSVSNDLKYDSERDLRDIGASKIEVHALNKVRDLFVSWVMCII